MNPFISINDISLAAAFYALEKVGAATGAPIAPAGHFFLNARLGATLGLGQRASKPIVVILFCDRSKKWQMGAKS